MSISQDELKEAYARWATGVTIITLRAGDRLHGMTASAFTEVSLAPPLVLVCVDKKANILSLIAEDRGFAVNILACGQEALSNRFASKTTSDDRFEGLDYETGKTGAPLLTGTVANLDCQLGDSHDAGDHMIYIGEVVELRVFDREPLLFYNREYREIAK